MAHHVQKKATKHHHHSRPRKTRPSDITRKKPEYPPIPDIPVWTKIDKLTIVDNEEVQKTDEKKADAFMQPKAMYIAGPVKTAAMKMRHQAPAMSGTDRRTVLGGAAASLLAAAPRRAYAESEQISKLGYDIKLMSRSELEKNSQKLTGFERAVALEAATERSFTGKTTNGYSHDNKQEGYYVGAVSGLPLFSSTEKYDSGTGWPSFWAPVDDQHVIIRKDPEDQKNAMAVQMGLVRDEVIDANSGAHLGHVFPDGPKPTGKRFCMNAAALTFVPSPKGAVPKYADQPA
jgi:methionine-R-sulfoxide reductase